MIIGYHLFTFYMQNYAGAESFRIKKKTNIIYNCLVIKIAQR